VGIPKTEFPSLLAALLEKANPGKHLPAAFEKCGLYPLNVEKAVERIPSRRMTTDVPSTRDLLDSTLGERLEELRGVGKGEKPKQRGKKLKVAPGKSYCDREDGDMEDGDMEDGDMEDRYMEGSDLEDSNKENSDVESSEEADEVLDLMDNVEEDSEVSEDEEELDKEHAGGQASTKEILYPVGSYCVAVYDGQWYVAQVEAEEPENECDGFTLLRYMERRGHNQFVWGAVDTLKTINSDILLKVDPPIPVSSRFWGLPKIVVKEADKLLMVKRSIIILSLQFICPKYVCCLSSLLMSCPAQFTFILSSCPILAVLSLLSYHSV
jgi:hypothetical protein